jgi:colicin import membrane protein
MIRHRTLARRSRLGALLASAMLAGVAAAAASADDTERQHIATERAAAEARYAARERECRERFVVTSCVDDAKRERRQVLDALKARQLRLDEAKRRARTDERRAELAAKAAEDARREQERAARPASVPASGARRDGLARSLEPRHEGAPSAVPHLGGLRDRPGGAGNSASAQAASSDAGVSRQSREARSRMSFETRQRQAAEHRQEVLDKAAKQVEKRHPADPLPLPASVPTR